MESQNICWPRSNCVLECLDFIYSYYDYLQKEWSLGVFANFLVIIMHSGLFSDPSAARADAEAIRGIAVFGII